MPFLFLSSSIVFVSHRLPGSIKTDHGTNETTCSSRTEIGSIDTYGNGNPLFTITQRIIETVTAAISLYLQPYRQVVGREEAGAYEHLLCLCTLKYNCRMACL